MEPGAPVHGGKKLETQRRQRLAARWVIQLRILSDPLPPLRFICFPALRRRNGMTAAPHLERTGTPTPLRTV